MITVWLESEDFGAEHFKYDSLPEALEGIGRLYAACHEAYTADHIERQITLCIGEADGNGHGL